MELLYLISDNILKMSYHQHTGNCIAQTLTITQFPKQVMQINEKGIQQTASNSFTSNVLHNNLNQQQVQSLNTAHQLDKDSELQIKQRNQLNQHQLKDYPSEQAFNYIDELICMQDIQDNFQICAEDQVNIGKTSTNLQLKEGFNIMRYSVQKLFNQEELSIQVLKLLPTQLEDDFNDFISYVKEKIGQIKNQNNLTFIAAEVGSQPQIEDISLELRQFLEKQSEDYLNLKKMIQQKQYLITSLLNQKTQQQNTITQQQNLQQQFQKLHLQQYQTLKNQIKLLRENIDKQMAYYQSLINIFKKDMRLWIDDQDNYQDFQDNLKLITTIYKFNTKEKKLIDSYLQKYKELKDIQ